GSPHLQKTVIPVEAAANLSVRLAPGQRPDEVAAEVERLLRAAAPEGAEVELERLSSSPPGLVPPPPPPPPLLLPPAPPPIHLPPHPFERVLPHRPLLVRSRGTLPILPAFAD